MSKKKGAKEHKIGEKFECCGIVYEVRESENMSCAGCALLKEAENHCTDQDGRQFEDCSGAIRKDGKSVIFVQIGEATD